MRLFLESVKDALIERAPEELIGAVLMALYLALIPAGIAAWRRRKAPDSPVVLGGLVFPCLLAAMILGLSYDNYTRAIRRVGPNDGHYRVSPAGLIPFSRPAFGTPTDARALGAAGDLVLSRLFGSADADHDGRLTPEEAAGFVARLDTIGRGSIETRDLSFLLSDRGYMSWGAEPPPARAGTGNVRAGGPSLTDLREFPPWTGRRR